MKIWINGFTGAGKTTISKVMGKKLELEVIHCDDFIAPGNWSEMPHIIIDKIKDKDNYVLEGTVVGRVARKIDELNLEIRPDKYYYLTEVFKETTKKQDSFNKAINTIQLEVDDVLHEWGVDIIDEIPTEDYGDWA
jgi:adenylate kinase family enzyme